MNCEEPAKLNCPWPSTLCIEELAAVVDVPLSQARRWARVGVIRSTERDGRRHLYPRDEAVLGTVARVLQHALGEQSPVPLAVAAELRPRVQGWLRWGETPPYPGPLGINLITYALRVHLEVTTAELDALCARLDVLGEHSPARP
jgi:hypothetical protein